MTPFPTTRDATAEGLPIVIMETDDAAILKDMAAKGAAIVTVTDLKPWRDAVSPVVASFSERFPDTWRDFRAQIGADRK